MVARLREIARSQMAGRARNSSGGMRVMGPGRTTASSRHPISPMSWYSGSQETPPCASSRGMMLSMAAAFASTLACVSDTGLGSTVVPLENWIRRRSSGRDGAEERVHEVGTRGQDDGDAVAGSDPHLAQAARGPLRAIVELGEGEG